MTLRPAWMRRAWPVAMLGIATLAGCSKAPPEPPPAPPPLSKQGLSLSSWKAASPDLHDRLLLANATAKGDTEAMVMVATEVGKTKEVAAAIAALGGDIQTRFDEVGYLRVRLALDRFAEVGALPNVLMAHLDGGGAHGLYANDRDLVRYPLSDADQSPATHRQSPESTDTLLGNDVGSASSSLAIEIESLLTAAVSNENKVLARDEDGGRLPGGGLDLFALMANRAFEVHSTPLLFAAGAFGRVESVTGASSGRRVISVGEFADNRLAVTASLGPAADGASKPDVLAPGGFANAASETEALIAAARAENLPADARHIAWALRMSARRVESLQAHQQGFGVIDTARALELLKQLRDSKLDLPDIQTRAPVKTYLSRFLPEPGIGQGLYEREGWLARQKDTRKITLLRQSGADTPLTYSLQWQGNDGTFKTAQQEVSLPFNEPVEIPLEISAADVGVHSAQLYLIDKASGLPVHALMTTIVAAEPFTAANNYRVELREQSLPGASVKRYFLDVAPNIGSLRLEAGVGAGQVQLMLTGGELDLLPSKIIAPNQPAVLLVPYPPPGVYEVTVLPTSAGAKDVSVAASIRYVDSQLDDKVPGVNSTTFWLNNIYAPLQRSEIVAEVGARRVLKDVGGAGGMRAYNISVEPGSTTLRVAASPPDGRARIGLYLYDCVTGACKLWGSEVFTRPATKSLSVATPRPGLWRVVVDATAPGTAFEYTQIVTHPRFGAGAVAGENTARKTGARWNQKVSFQVGAAAPFGHDLVGLMDIIDPVSEADERAAPFSDWQATGDARHQPLRPVRLTTQVLRLDVRGAPASGS
ncbi:S8/S53 family peptidase [Peristeroidobacter agariperforans]|uniref:hypothetical protein n=1 Tax=Peristeroidobacter agariperforans TaxID=268404 RepID=UPI00101D3767|nr:hypothetical protein [Peristeroidobacter agariperforans]